MFCSSCGALGYIQPNGALECQRCDHVDQKVTTITPDSEIGVEYLYLSVKEEKMQGEANDSLENIDSLDQLSRACFHVSNRIVTFSGTSLIPPSTSDSRFVGIIVT